jgi:hypothetical protein
MAKNNSSNGITKSEEGKLYFTNERMLEIKYRNMLTKESERELKNYELQIELERMNIELLKRTITEMERKVEDMYRSRDGLILNIAKRRKAYSDYIEQTTKELELPSKWNYDDETGEVSEVETPPLG